MFNRLPLLFALAFVIMLNTKVFIVPAKKTPGLVSVLGIACPAA
jgi:hypothetical protein